MTPRLARSNRTSERKMTTTNEDAGAERKEAFEAYLRKIKFPVLPVWQDGKPHQNYALELMWQAWEGAIAHATTAEQVEGVHTQAARDVLAERQRQVSLEGWTPEHDDEHDSGEMASAAAAYALHSCGWHMGKVRDVWPAPWSLFWLKPSTPRRDLVKAGALILAEIERIDRAASSTGDQEVGS
ncbi:hypothetical protein [Paraburkholderia fungorum]|uniref:hypothetical protein n=1 Tax=Paraburkholderia fungorum TaxID=134537 RepID=UPI003878329C